MNISALFLTLREVEREIERASVSRDADLLNLLDEQHDSAWQNILRYKPQMASDAEQMLSQLLDKICDDAEHSNPVAQIRQKIMELFEIQSILSINRARSRDISIAAPALA